MFGCQMIKIFQVAAFTAHRFKGNPAAVMPLERFLDDDLLQSIAAENNLAETAFLVREQDAYQLRWFTPTVEVPLCGHATLASAAVVMERLEPGRQSVVFHTASGPLSVRRAEAGYRMDFPAYGAAPTPLPPGLTEALGVEPKGVWENDSNYLVLLNDAEAVRSLAPDMKGIGKLWRDGLIVTAAGDAEFDFISRYFAPKKGVPEDPVTGGAHCMLAPFWAERLGKQTLRAFQASRRGGEMTCRVIGDRVELAGSCVFYMEGVVEV